MCTCNLSGNYYPTNVNASTMSQNIFCRKTIPIVNIKLRPEKIRTNNNIIMSHTLKTITFTQKSRCSASACCNIVDYFPNIARSSVANIDTIVYTHQRTVALAYKGCARSVPLPQDPVIIFGNDIVQSTSQTPLSHLYNISDGHVRNWELVSRGCTNIRH